MKVIAIKQSSSGQNIHFISDEFTEYALIDILSLNEKNSLENIKVFSTKSGRQAIRLKPNKSTSDNLEKVAITCNEMDYLLFDRHFVYLKTQNGRIKKKWHSFSGNIKSEFKDQDKPDFGPLPEGEYKAHFTQTLDALNNEGLWDTLKWIQKSPAWGFVATPLEQTKGNSYGRGNFYIHGGLFKGTKGCIEINNFENGEFHAFMRLYKRDFKLVVKYK